MGERRWSMLAVAVAVALLSGCSIGPSLDDGRSKLAQFAPVPMPVPPGPDGGWHYVDPVLGLIGEGDRLARVDFDGTVTWSVRLPPEYALTGAHRPVPTFGGGLLILWSTTSARALNLGSGALQWEQPLPPVPGDAGVTQAGGGLSATVALSRCSAAGCTIVGVELGNGTTMWRSEVPGAAFVTNGEDPLVGGRGAAPPLETADGMTSMLYAVGGQTVVPISPGDGKAGPPFDGVPGPADQIVSTYSAVLVIGRPAAPGCTVTIRGYPRLGPSTPWTRQVQWDDPRAARGADGCRYDRAFPIIHRFDLTVPEAGGARAIDVPSGAPGRALAAGAYRLTYDLRWEDGRYRTEFDNQTLPYTPGAGGPWALTIGGGPRVVADGDGLTLCSQAPCDHRTWHVPGARAVLRSSTSSVVFATATQLITVTTAGSKRVPKTS